MEEDTTLLHSIVLMYANLCTFAHVYDLVAFFRYDLVVLTGQMFNTFVFYKEILVPFFSFVFWGAKGELSLNLISKNVHVKKCRERFRAS